MLFNSYPFLFGFLPLVLVGYFILGRKNCLVAAAWLAFASLFFYAWWNPAYLGLLLASIGINFFFAETIARYRARGRFTQSRYWLIIALTANLALLGYYKYADFFRASFHQLTGISTPALDIVLPLGISFFTFTQIAFLVDTHRGTVRESSFIHYLLFVTYFPHLVAGPVLHHQEMMPQFRSRSVYQPQWENLAVGLSIFLIGLYKKTVLADGVAEYVGPVFTAAAQAQNGGPSLTLLEAWGGALAYSLQIYFDFSAYSDMAIGLSRLFGIQLPINFNSPYKATSIIEFWRRWHITLSRFLRDYLYIALGGNRRGRLRRHANLFMTMVLGGLWHGAGWTFVAWGALHGAYLMINHTWSHLRQRWGEPWPGERFLAQWLTFIAVVVAWVFFRSPDFATAVHLLTAMVGGNGLILPDTWVARWGSFGYWLGEQGLMSAPLVHFNTTQFNWLWLLLMVCWLMPNTQQVMATYRPGLVSPGYGAIVPTERLGWSPSLFWLLLLGLVGGYALLCIPEFTEFIYFQF